MFKFVFLCHVDQLKNIWSPTNIYLSKQYEKGTWTTSKKPPDVKALRGRVLRVGLVDVSLENCHLNLCEFIKFSVYFLGRAVRIPKVPQQHDHRNRQGHAGGTSGGPWIRLGVCVDGPGWNQK